MGDEQGRPSTIPTDEARPIELSEAFIRERWPKLAGFAWRAYMQDGRGAVTLPWQAVVAHASGAGFNLELRYLRPFEDPHLALLRFNVSDYDPETSIVVLYLEEEDYRFIVAGSPGSPHGRHLVHRFRGPTAPSRAHALTGN